MAVDGTGDDRSAPERPQRSGGRPKERLSCFARNGRFSAQGKKTIRPLRMPIEPSIARRSLVRHAPSRPQWTCQLADKGCGNGIIGRRQWEWMHSAHKPQTSGQSHRLDVGGSRERCIASSRCWLWCHAWTDDKTEACSLPHSQLQTDHTPDKSGLQATQCFPPGNPFL